MRCNKNTCLRPTPNSLLLSLLLLFFLSSDGESATVKDVFNLNTQLSARVPRDNKYYSGRYGSSSSSASSPLNRAIKPEDSPEAHDVTPLPVEKRCTRCSDSQDWRYPYESRTRYDDRRPSYNRDRYDYDDRRYDRYDDRDRDRRYNRYDRYEDRDRYRPDYYDRDRDRYFDRDRYIDKYDRYNDRDRYDDRDRYNDRGIGYDNRGYDYRERGYDRDSGYRPWDETYRGTSGFDNSGRGYYFATGRPEVGGGGGYWGGAGGGYASSWNYGGGSGGGRDDYRDRYAGYRPRDPYDGYRSTSYLYGRPSSTTTIRPENSVDGNSGVTQNPQQENSSG